MFSATVPGAWRGSGSSGLSGLFGFSGSFSFFHPGNETNQINQTNQIDPPRIALPSQHTHKTAATFDAAKEMDQAHLKKWNVRIPHHKI